MSHRIKVSAPYHYDPSTGAFDLVDQPSGVIISTYTFQDLSRTGWLDKQHQIAEGLAQALNAAPNAAIEHILQLHREARHLKDHGI